MRTLKGIRNGSIKLTNNLKPRLSSTSAKQSFTYDLQCPIEVHSTFAVLKWPTIMKLLPLQGPWARGSVFCSAWRPLSSLDPRVNWTHLSDHHHSAVKLHIGQNISQEPAAEAAYSSVEGGGTRTIWPCSLFSLDHRVNLALCLYTVASEADCVFMEKRISHCKLCASPNQDKWRQMCHNPCKKYHISLSLVLKDTGFIHLRVQAAFNFPVNNSDGGSVVEVLNIWLLVFKVLPVTLRLFWLIAVFGWEVKCSKPQIQSEADKWRSFGFDINHGFMANTLCHRFCLNKNVHLHRVFGWTALGQCLITNSSHWINKIA